MPVEIRELIIKAYVEPATQRRAGTTDREDVQEDEAIDPIAENLDQFMDLLKNKNER